MYHLCQYPRDVPWAQGTSVEALLALSNTGVIREVEHLQKYLLEEPKTPVSVAVPGRLYYEVLASPPHPASALLWLPGSCWGKGHLAGSGPGLWEPSKALRHVSGHTIHCREEVASVQRLRSSSSLAWRIDFSDALLPTACLFSGLKTESQEVCAQASFRHATFLARGLTAGQKVSDLTTCLVKALCWWPLVHRVKSKCLSLAPGSLRGLLCSPSQPHPSPATLAT